MNHPQAIIRKIPPKKDLRDKMIDYIHNNWFLGLAVLIVVSWVLLIANGSFKPPTYKQNTNLQK